MKLKVDLQIGVGRRRKKFSDAHQALLHRAAEILEEVVNTDEFRQKVLEHTWKNANGETISGYTHTGDSPEEVYAKLMSGMDQFVDLNGDDENELNDGDIDIWVFPYRTRKKYVGYTTPGNYITFLNINYVDSILKYGTEEEVAVKLAENQLHEYLHNVGYQHDGNNPNKNNNRESVPYALGYMVGEVYAEIKNGAEPISPPLAAVNDEWHWDESRHA